MTAFRVAQEMALVRGGGAVREALRVAHHRLAARLGGVGDSREALRLELERRHIDGLEGLIAEFQALALEGPAVRGGVLLAALAGLLLLWPASPMAAQDAIELRSLDDFGTEQTRLSISSAPGAQVKLFTTFNAQNNPITGLPAPSLAGDAATKGYVDTLLGGFSGPFLQLAPATAQPSAAATPLIFLDETAPGAPNLIHIQVAGADRFVVDNLGRVSIGSIPWAGVTDTPATFPPAAHTHADADISDTLTITDGSVAASVVSGALTGASLPWGNLTSVPAGFADGADNDTDTWRPLGAGSGDAAPGNHTHAADGVASDLLRGFGAMEDWSNGASNPPDEWSFYNSGLASVARESTDVKVGASSVKVYPNEWHCALRHSFRDSVTSIGRMQGRAFTFGVWVKATGTGDSVRLIDDAGSSSTEIPNTGVWTWVTVTRTVSSTTSSLRAEVWVSGLQSPDRFAPVTVDGAVLEEGTTVTQP